MRMLTETKTIRDLSVKQVSRFIDKSRSIQKLKWRIHDNYFPETTMKDWKEHRDFCLRLNKNYFSKREIELWEKAKNFYQKLIAKHFGIEKEILSLGDCLPFMLYTEINCDSKSGLEILEIIDYGGGGGGGFAYIKGIRSLFDNTPVHSVSVFHENHQKPIGSPYYISIHDIAQDISAQSAYLRGFKKDVRTKEKYESQLIQLMKSIKKF